MRLKAPPSSQYLCYAPWNAPPPHPGAYEPCYGPCTDDSAPGHGAWHETRQNFPPVPVMASFLFAAILSSPAHISPLERWDPMHRSGSRNRRWSYFTPLGSREPPRCNLRLRPSTRFREFRRHADSNLHLLNTPIEFSTDRRGRPGPHTCG